MEDRAYVFVDGQNLFYAAKEAFGYRYPNYDVIKLASTICQDHGWALEKVAFYTGVPEISDNRFWHNFWANKTAIMGKKGVRVFTRPLRYRNKSIELPDKSYVTTLVGTEKGIDIRVALDMVRFALNGVYDVCLIFSQDQDLTEAVDEVRHIAKTQGRRIILASAFPYSPTSRNTRGINRTDWIKIDKVLYDRCIDPSDYRPDSK